MWDQPHFVYHVDVDSLAALTDLELHIPGTLVYGRIRGRRIRVEKAEAHVRQQMSEVEVIAPVNAAWLVEGYLVEHGIPYDAESVGVNGVGFWDDAQRQALEEEGRAMVEELSATGTVRTHVSSLITPYQAMGVAWAIHRPWAFFIYSCGAGKTLAAILAALTRPGPILVVCPAKARHVWWSQIQEYTTIEPYRLRPESERRKGEPTLTEYLERTTTAGTRPFVVVGAEALPDNITAVRQVNPTVLILDELHTHGSHKRWKAIHQADGGVAFTRRKTAASQDTDSMTNREVRACATMDTSRLPNLQLRIGLTATPLDDGRPRRLWSQLDLLVPGGFSFSYGKFATRYCAARPGDFGGLNDAGSSHLDELKARCSFLVHEVPYNESHAALPSTRVQVVYLDNSELNRAERWSDKQTFNQAIKGIAKEKDRNPLAREMMIEARLAEACSRKRRYVIDEAIQGLRGGGKVAIFTARRRETEKWVSAIEKALSVGDSALGRMPVWMAHGGVSERDRDNIVDQFRSSSGPCCLVATGQSIGTGVDGLQTTDLAIFAMLPWKPGDFVQWKGRFDRLGGNPTLLKVIVASNTYDERVVDILVQKFGPIAQMLAADELQGLDEKLLGLEDKDALLDSIIDKLGDLK